MVIPGVTFAGISVMTVAGWLQLSSGRGYPIFCHFSDMYSMEYLLGLQLWHLLKYAELAKVFRQKDKLFIDLLNKTPVGDIDADTEKLLKTIFIYESNDKTCKRCLAHVRRERTSYERDKIFLK